MKEIWKDVIGYEGLYQVSNLGMVKSIGRAKTKGGKIKQSLSNGYYRVCLCKEGDVKNLAVHRLVAEVFVPNPNDYEVVNHKDENKKNNKSDNLEWCTQAYNVQYSKGTSAILQYNLDGKFIKEWESALEVEKILGYDNSCIIKCCKGKRKTHKNFMWKYKNCPVA